MIRAVKVYLKVVATMSSLSLNRLCNGGRESKNKNLNWKFGSSSTLPTKKHVPKIQPIDVNNNEAPPVAMVRRKLLNRRGSLHHNQFKGVKKEMIEKHASQIVHTMTVRISRREKQFLIEIFYFFI